MLDPNNVQWLQGVPLSDESGSSGWEENNPTAAGDFYDSVL